MSSKTSFFRGPILDFQVLPQMSVKEASIKLIFSETTENYRSCRFFSETGLPLLTPAAKNVSVEKLFGRFPIKKKIPRTTFLSDCPWYRLTPSSQNSNSGNSVGPEMGREGFLWPLFPLNVIVFRRIIKSPPP